MNEDNKKKRCRSNNFTSDEKLLLLEIIKKYKHVIENKSSGVMAWKSKENVWIKVVNEFNASATNHRTVEILKRFYNNKKKKTRKQAATDRLQVSGTGGGPYLGKTNDPIFNLTMDIINKKSVHGLNNKHDDDNICYSQNSSLLTEGVPSCSTDYQPLIEVDDLPPPTEIDYQPPIRNNDYPPLLEVDDLPPPTEIDYQPPIRSNDYPPLIEVDDLPPPTEIEDHLPPPERSRLRRSNPRRLQTSKFGNVALKYEEVAELKKEVFGLQRDYYIACQQGLKDKLEWEANQRKMEEARRVEEFNLKRKALTLDVQIKEAQLEALKKCVN